MVRRSILSLIFLLASRVLSFGEDVLSTVFEPNPVGVRDNSSLVIDLPLESSAGVEVVLPELPGGVEVWRGPYVRSYSGEDYADQGYLQFVRISLTLRSSDPGRKVIPPIRIESDRGDFLAGPFLLEVGLYRSASLQIPLEPFWEPRFRRIHEGQTVPLILMVPDCRELLLVDEVSAPPPREGLFEAAQGLGTLRKEERGGFSFYTIPAAAYLFTPERPGRVEIPRARVRIGDVEDSSQALVLEVEAAPEEISATGAVGQFRYEAVPPREGELQKGDTFSLTLRVEGTGNLPYLSIPAPEFRGVDQISVNRKESLRADAGGYAGWREDIYHCVVTSPESVTIIYPPFPFLVPETGRVVVKTIPESSYSLTPKDQPGGDTGSITGPFPFAPREDWDRGISRAVNYYRLPANYLWLLPGPMLFLVFFLAGKGRRGSGKAALSLVLLLFLSASGPEGPNSQADGEDSATTVWEAAQVSYEEGEYANALEGFSRLSRQFPHDVALHYNASLAAWQSGEPGLSLWHARRGYREKPGDGKFPDLIAFYEQELGILFPLPLPVPVHPDLFFFVLLLACNGSGFFGVFYLLHRRNHALILTLFLLFLSAAAALALGLSARNHLLPAGVVVESGSAMLIPEESSAPAFPVKPGETVRVIGASKGFLFINTGMDTRGWFPEENILPLTGENY